MSRVVGLLVTAILFGGFVGLTLLLAACRSVYGHLTGQPS
jgi:hypothetical protein